MAFGWDDAAMLALQALSATGGILGKKRKHIDPEMLRQRFGPGAVSKDTIELANYILNSPQGQQLLANAAESGQQFENNVNANAASAGLAGPGGSSGTGVFATSAGTQAQSGFERAIKGNVYQAALPIAAQGVANRQAAYIADLTGGGYQDDRAAQLEGLGSAAANALTLVQPKAQVTKTNPNEAATGVGVNMLPSAPTPTPVTASLQQSQMAAAQTPSMLRRRARNKSMQSIFNRGYVQPAYQAVA